MKVALAADHAGFELKQYLAKWLADQGIAVVDLGTHDENPIDYPDVAVAAARAIVEGRVERAIVICGSGAGACVAANKIKGIRASIAHDNYTAHQMVEHDDVNVLCLGSRVIGTHLAEDVVKTFLDARYSNEDRHRRRLAKIEALEN
ncbi:MAG TPA: ribose 5-phosphate isomerase B [Acidimicrobiia bacterium]